MLNRRDKFCIACGAELHGPYCGQCGAAAATIRGEAAAPPKVAASARSARFSFPKLNVADFKVPAWLLTAAGACVAGIAIMLFPPLAALLALGVIVFFHRLVGGSEKA